MQRVLSFEQTPPLSIPLRFFLSAPVFAMAAALLLLWHGEAVLVSRWSPLTLAFTHLLTLGFLGLCMIGAVLQIMPVVAGVEVPRPTLVANLAHAFLSAGAAALSAGFLTMSPMLFQAAILLLVAAFGIFLVACWLGLKGVDSENVTLSAIRLSLLALGATVVIGAVIGAALGSVFAWPMSLPIVRLTDLHAAWGLAGWLGLLVAAVAFQVVPMFQVTEVYPQIVTVWFARCVFGILVALTLAAALLPEPLFLPAVTSTIVALLYMVFACVTWHLILRRKRPKSEPTTFFWYISLASLTVACLLFMAGQLSAAIGHHAMYSLSLGVLVLIGFAYSVVNGMLYKIVPFLVWYHLQDRLFEAGMKAPNVKQVIAEESARRQLLAHGAALLLSLAAVISPGYFARPAAAAFLISSFWLWKNLLTGAKVYRECLAAAAAAQKSTISGATDV